MACFQRVSNKSLMFAKTLLKPSQLKLPVRWQSTSGRHHPKTGLTSLIIKLSGGCVLCGCGLAAYIWNKYDRLALSDKFCVKALAEDKPTPSPYNFLADIVEKSQPALVFIEVSLRHPQFNAIAKSAGSGFIVREDGLILTNAHVVSQKTEVNVKLQDGRVLKGQVQAVDPVTDLATVKINATNLPTLKLGKSSASRPGEFVIAMGSPLTLSNSVTHGIISSVHRGSEELGMHNRDMEYIQTDAAITKGNSGGPLVNMNGEVIGINTMVVISGIAFAIPSDKAAEFLQKAEKLENRAKNRKASWFNSGTKDNKMKFIGITMFSLNPESISELQTRIPNFPKSITSGVMVPSVIYGSPAHRGGLQPGDIIVRINDRDIGSSNDVLEAVKSNETLTIDVYRQNKKLVFSVVPEPVE